jgi:hypothetical protein
MSDSGISGAGKGKRIERAQTARPFDGFDRRLGLVALRAWTGHVSSVRLFMSHDWGMSGRCAGAEREAGLVAAVVNPRQVRGELFRHRISARWPFTH